MLRPCDDSVFCPDDFVGNFSSETDDTLDFISRKFRPSTPPLKQKWTATMCGVTFVSNISQADADLQAASLIGFCAPCTDADCPPPPPTFCNNAQLGCVVCPDGTQSCFGINAGVFCGYANQAAADGAAFSAALILARGNPVCPGPLTKCTCVGSGYMSTITANVPVTWTLVGGSLPPGLAFSGGIDTTTTSIFGIPTTAGTYTFQLRAQSDAGSFALKTYSIVVLQVATPSLPPFTIGVPYSFQLQAIGGSGSYQWKIVSGSLPNGLSMDINGLITGTPS